MDGYSFTFIGAIIGSITGIVSCAACIYRFRKRREQLPHIHQSVIPPLTEQIARQPNISYPVPLPPQGISYQQFQYPQQQPYVIGYSQPLTPVGYYSYPQPSAPLAPHQSPYSV